MSRGSCGEMMRDGSLRSLFEDYAHPPPPSPPSLLLPSGEVGAARYSTICLPELHLPALGLVRGRLVVSVFVCQAIQLLSKMNLHRETANHPHERPGSSHEDQR